MASLRVVDAETELRALADDAWPDARTPMAFTRMVGSSARGLYFETRRSFALAPARGQGDEAPIHYRVLRALARGAHGQARARARASSLRPRARARDPRASRAHRARSSRSEGSATCLVTCHALECAWWHASCAATCARARACALERPLTIQSLSLRPRANRRASASPQMARGCFCRKPDARKTPSRARHRRRLRRPTRRAASKPRCRALQLLASTTTPPRTAATGTPRARTERGGRLNARGGIFFALARTPRSQVPPFWNVFQTQACAERGHS